MPTRGTTRERGRNGGVDCDFNPRAHEGHDHQCFADPPEVGFQSTCPRGARRPDGRCFLRCWISIHVPTRGTTQCLGYLLDQATISIHVPTRGTTKVSKTESDQRSYFNPRAHEGHDPTPPTRQQKQRFQSTCPRGARLLPYR